MYSFQRNSHPAEVMGMEVNAARVSFSALTGNPAMEAELWPGVL